jgi:anti-sigma regulatory factor (Ser/Thr protein kinase)
VKELSLHILDIVQNSIKAGASLIELYIVENSAENIFSIKVKDNGCGMNEETVKNVVNPFFTTRTTRKVGLGLPLLQEAALRCNGTFDIQSEKGVGTSVFCTFDRDSIDRAPLGDISSTIMTIVNSLENCELIYIHVLDDKDYEFSTMKVKEILEEINLKSYDILLWIKEYIEESSKKLYNI